VRDAAPVPVAIIANGQNLGFPRAVNQGLQAARGEDLVRLNNDAVAADGWLEQLIAPGAMNEAARLWHAVLAECPGDREALANLERLAGPGRAPSVGIPAR
jgi:GT2 family glycosyltransferase